MHANILPSTMTTSSYLHQSIRGRKRLVEWVGAGTPVGEEKGETDSLKDTGESTDSDGVKRALLGNDLGDDLGVLSVHISRQSSF